MKYSFLAILLASLASVEWATAETPDENLQSVEHALATIDRYLVSKIKSSEEFAIVEEAVENITSKVKALDDSFRELVAELKSVYLQAKEKIKPVKEFFKNAIKKLLHRTKQVKTDGNAKEYMSKEIKKLLDDVVKSIKNKMH